MQRYVGKDHHRRRLCFGVWGFALALWIGFAPGCGDVAHVDARPAASTAARAPAAIGGVEYRHLRKDGPLSIHVVEIDLSRPELSLHATVGPGVKGTHAVASFAARPAPGLGDAIAAINGDYFEFLTEPRYHGTLQGTCIVEGELVSTPGFPTFWVDGDGRPHLEAVASRLTVQWPDGSTTGLAVNASTSDYRSEVRAANVVLFTPRFGASTFTEPARELVLEPANDDGPWLPLRANQTYRARIREVVATGNARIPRDAMVLSIARAASADVPELNVGDELTIHTGCTQALSEATAAVAGSPPLLAGGQLLPGLNDTSLAPRTAVGFAGRRVLFVVVDGRQEDLSIGMTHRELAELMQRLGCTDAVNLDGGGSSTMWYRGSVVNSPSDGRQRAVGNALLLRWRAVPADGPG